MAPYAPAALFVSVSKATFQTQQLLPRSTSSVSAPMLQQPFCGYGPWIRMATAGISRSSREPRSVVSETENYRPLSERNYRLRLTSVPHFCRFGAIQYLETENELSDSNNIKICVNVLSV